MKKQSLAEALTEGFSDKSTEIKEGSLHFETQLDNTILENINEGKGMKPKDLIGKNGEDYHQSPGKIVDAAYVKNWKKLQKHDNSGWLDQDSIDEYELEPKDILVAFDSEHGTEVYTFGGGGVELSEGVLSKLKTKRVKLTEGADDKALEKMTKIMKSLKDTGANGSDIVKGDIVVYFDDEKGRNEAKPLLKKAGYKSTDNGKQALIVETADEMKDAEDIKKDKNVELDAESLEAEKNLKA